MNFPLLMLFLFLSPNAFDKLDPSTLGIYQQETTRVEEPNVTQSFRCYLQ
jgi:hypothetical protein